MSNIHKRGFASLPMARRLEIARMGGTAAHRPALGKKRGHEWTSAEASAAARKSAAVQWLKRVQDCRAADEERRQPIPGAGS